MTPGIIFREENISIKEARLKAFEILRFTGLEAKKDFLTNNLTKTA